MKNKKEKINKHKHLKKNKNTKSLQAAHLIREEDNYDEKFKILHIQKKG